MILVNAMGDACPIPVVKTKNAIRQLPKEGGVVKTLVDNEIAVQNLTKMANQKGYGVSSEKIGEQKFEVVMTLGEEFAAGSEEPSGEEDAVSCTPDRRRKNTVVTICSETMGKGDETLGKALMKAFLFALAGQDELPDTILFYNGGAKLTCEGSPALEDILSMEASGVEILTCGTCLNHYGLTEQLKVGSITNMYTIVEKQMQAQRIIQP